jgi:hemerythrin-like domain-containing protein
MKPRGPLMIEHRLIEKMIAIINQNLSDIEITDKIDPNFIDIAVDFIKIYADKTHHGKEEDILFRDCIKKNLSAEDTRIMNELIEEHKYGRKIVGELIQAKENYIKGNDTLDIIIEKLRVLVEFYPKHIEKEDKIFFPNSEKYFSDEELQFMLNEFWEFDRVMIHKKYEQVIEELEIQNC